MKCIQLICRFLRSEDGTAAVEYAVLLAMILLVIIVGVTSAGGGVSQWWTDISDDMINYTS
jgi:pilus assembly protein Flp/PilA